jgi:hypothetical protein
MEPAMLLELGKALSFLASILSLYLVAASAFFAPATFWNDRLLLALPELGIAACICFLSGLLFAWPSRSNPDARQSLISTLPVRLFLWAVAAMAVLFVISWYAVGLP